MARCGCAQGCSCAVIGIDTESVATTVTGNGALATPYQVESHAILLPDGDPPLLGANALKVGPDGGLYVDELVAEPTCAWGFNGHGIETVETETSNSIPISAATGGINGQLFVTANGAAELPAGMWTIHGFVVMDFGYAAATGDIVLNYLPAPLSEGSDPARAGQISGSISVIEADKVTVWFSGVVLQDADWNPELTIMNSTDQDADCTVTYNAFGMACAYPTTSTTGGGG